MSAAHMVQNMAKTPHRCSCGCSGCQGDCCSLECLIRPNFFCGQLLTDRDLKVFLDWVSAKAALQRFREGWGVVCGLETTCGHLEGEHNRVYAGEGYAVDCCGRDIVVCEPIWYDFQCDTLTDPCCREKKVVALPGAAGPKRVQPAGVTRLGSIPLEELRAFDLCLVSDEQMTGGQRAMVRGNCAPMDDCQFTRVKETGKLAAKEVADPFAPARSHEIDDYRLKLRDFLESLYKNSNTPLTLLTFLSGKLHSFCFLEDWLCKLSRPAGGPPADWQDDIFPYIVQDFRNHYFLCSCVSCASNSCDGDGVPLSRVWIWDRKDANCRMCKVVYIESRPPFRRPLSRACRPTEPGCLDVSPYIWRDRDEVAGELKQIGYEHIALKESSMNDIAVLADREILCLRRGEKTIMHFRADPYGQPRVVAFQAD
jgi:hypothetical protein